MDSWNSFIRPVTGRSLGCACQQETCQLALLDSRIQAAGAYARQFSNFEWKYLCSYRWFLEGVDRGLHTGNFLPLQRRAEDELVNEGLRRRILTVDDELRLCHSRLWFD
jgi:hypothetical protein